MSDVLERAPGPLGTGDRRARAVASGASADSCSPWDPRRVRGSEESFVATATNGRTSGCRGSRSCGRPMRFDRFASCTFVVSNVPLQTVQDKTGLWDSGVGSFVRGPRTGNHIGFRRTAPRARRADGVSARVNCDSFRNNAPHRETLDRCKSDGRETLAANQRRSTDG